MNKPMLLVSLVLLAIVLVAGCSQQPTGRALEVDTQQNTSPTENQQSSQGTSNPCANIVCSDYCSGNTRYINGYCVDGQCKYSSDYCQNGCNNGRCNPLTTASSTTSNVNRVGSTVEMSGLRITLNGIRTEYHIGTYYTYINKYQNEAKDGYKYLIVLITTENIGSNSKYVSPLYLTLLDGNKNQYEYSSATYSLISRFESKDLLSGAKNSGEVAFEVPESATSLKLYYEVDSYNEIYAIWDLSNVNASTSSAKECGNTGQACCDNQCKTGNVCSGDICAACGKDNQPPCSDGCSIFYELIGGVCVQECSYRTTRIDGVCVSCGDIGQPCCDKYSSCLSYPPSTCVDGICHVCVDGHCIE